MKKIFSLLLLVGICLSVVAQKVPAIQYVRLTSSNGECIIKLYNDTPLHRDNFVKLVSDGFYKDLLFHRVIENFMVQGGDPDSRYAGSLQRLGSGGPDYKVPAEFRDSLYHRKGVLAAARDNNPEKASSASQFYLVQGRTFTDAGLDSLETIRLGGRKIPPYQREVYKSIGGVPHLDQNYTVFGEVVKGIELIDSIAAVRTNEFDRPVVDVKMDMVLLDKKEAQALERELMGLPPKRPGFFKRLFGGA